MKVITNEGLKKNKISIANNFLRHVYSKNTKNLYQHMGIYQFKVSTLEKFVKLPQSVNEKKNKLEQLRALDNNININVALAETNSMGVDTKEDFLAIKKIMEYNKL